MDHKTFFLTHWDKEAAATRKVISRIPQSHVDYRPDPKARTARELAWMIVYEEIALGDGLRDARMGRRLRHATIGEILQTCLIGNTPALERNAGDRLPPLGRRAAFLVRRKGSHEGHRVRDGVGIPARPDPSPRPALDVSSSDGRQGAGNLRPERGRSVVRGLRCTARLILRHLQQPDRALDIGWRERDAGTADDPVVVRFQHRL